MDKKVKLFMKSQGSVFEDASVAMKDGIFRTVIRKPLNTPTSMPSPNINDVRALHPVLYHFEVYRVWA